MTEKTITVVCYYCLETFECNYPGHSAMRECPICEGSNWVMAPAPENLGVYSHVPRKLKQR